MRTLHLGGVALIGALLMTTLFGGVARAHPMPHSVLELDLHDNDVSAELELPLADLGLAMGVDLQADPERVVVENETLVVDYLAAHFSPSSHDGRAWSVEFDKPTVTGAEQTSTGPYQEVHVTATLTPPPGGDTRSFDLGYDAIVHQVVTHTALVSISQDWASGSVDHSDSAEVGVVRIDTSTGEVKAVTIDAGSGSTWRGFAAMVGLGISHIGEGTDHLLFLLTLLLPAPLLVAGRRWGGFSGVRPSVVTITRITLAFTLGHSATLVFASVGRWALPTAPIEALIAVSILISALHAIRPLFPGRETMIAAFFGLIHGAAFSFTLAELGLTTPRLLLSLLGFNLGIEIMQLFLVALVLPALIVLASTRAYTPIRVAGSVVAIIASVGWFVDRIGFANYIAQQADRLGSIGPWMIVVLIAAAVTAVLVRRSDGPQNGPGPHREATKATLKTGGSTH